MANTHPNSIFRWEDAASLEHACWQCPTKANSPRALQTCYGVHSMPCTSYHPTMHAIGAAHRCSGCVMTREMHDARHREIAELLAEYRSLEQPAQETPTRQTPLLERPPNLAAVQRRRERQAGVARYEYAENDYPYDEDQNPFSTAAAIGGDENDDDFADIVSISSSNATPEVSAAAANSSSSSSTPSKKPTKAEVRAQKKAKKSVKSQTKALKNQTRHLASVTSADVALVARTLHGDDAQGQGSTQDGLAHPLATDRTIEDVIARNLNFVKSIQAHKQYLFKSVAAGRREVKERKRQKKRESRGGELGEDALEMDEVVSAIMIKLGVAPAVVAASATTSSNSSSYSCSSSSSTASACSSGSSANSIASSNAASAMVLRSSSTNANANTNGCTTSGGQQQRGSRIKRAPSITSTLTSTTTPYSAPSNKSSSSSGCNKATAAIASKLRSAIKADLEKHENEVHMRYVRAGGFWRYVGKSVFERMTEIASELDVGTGERWDKKWIREGNKKSDSQDIGDNDNDNDNGGAEAMDGVVAVGEDAVAAAVQESCRKTTIGHDMDTAASL